MTSNQYIHPANRTELMERRRLAMLPSPECGSRYVPCAVLHPGIRGCWNVPFRKFPGIVRGVWPMYAVIHLVSALLFRSKASLRSPLRTLLKTAWKASRSALFVSVLIHGYEGECDVLPAPRVMFIDHRFAVPQALAVRGPPWD